MKWWPDEPKTGDMIRVSCGNLFHYGVYIADDEIIQFGPSPLARKPETKDSEIEVERTDAEHFTCGKIVEVAVLDRKELRKRVPVEKTVEIARGRIGEKGYNILHNNCEHFAYECVMGVKVSEQENRLRELWKKKSAVTALPNEGHKK